MPDDRGETEREREKQEKRVRSRQTEERREREKQREGGLDCAETVLQSKGCLGHV